MRMVNFVRTVCISTALTFCAHALAAPAASAGYTVKVKMANPGNSQTLVSYPSGSEYVRNTHSSLEDGYQVFRGSVDGIVKADFVVQRPENDIQLNQGFLPAPPVSFVLRNGAHIVIEGDVEKPYMASVQGDDAQVQAYEVFRLTDKVFEDERWSMLKKAYAADPPSPDEAAFTALDAKRKVWMREFVGTHPGTYAAIEVFSMYAMDLTDGERAMQFAALPDAFKDSALGVVIAGKIRSVETTSPGKPVLSFSQKGSDGNTVDIAALKGNVVLIDFWGSWCMFCREAHPHLKELYSKYKDAGFEIVGVAHEEVRVPSEGGLRSRERQEKIWRQAIAKDGITWLQVLNDPSGTDLVKMYGVAIFPTKLLVDRKGVIRGRFVGNEGNGFDRMLEELLAEAR